MKKTILVTAALLITMAFPAFASVGYDLPESAKKYLDIADGFTPAHLAPAASGIWDNAGASFVFGLGVFGILLFNLVAVALITRKV